MNLPFYLYTCTFEEDQPILFVTSIFTIIYVSLFSPSFPFPQSFSISLSITRRKQTHLPPPLVIVMVCQSVRVPHSRGFSESLTRPALLFSDTCQRLICHLWAEMEMSRSDTTCQRWWWRLTSLHQLLNTLHGSQLMRAGWATIIICAEPSHEHRLKCGHATALSLWSCNAADIGVWIMRDVSLSARLIIVNFVCVLNGCFHMDVSTYKPTDAWSKSVGLLRGEITH